MATWIICLVLIGCVYFAAKAVIKAHKSGGCIGCDACGGSAAKGKEKAKPCCCCHETSIKINRKEPHKA